MKVSKNFTIQEFVSKEIYARWGNNSIWFVDERLIKLVQALRDEFGAITINNDHFNQSAFREPKSTVGASMSQHRFGRAADLKFVKMSVQEVYDAILKNEQHWMNKGLTTLENINHTPTWLHVDIRMTNMSKIKIVNP